MPPPVGTRISVHDGLQWRCYYRVLSIVVCIHDFHLEAYRSRIRWRTNRLSRWHICSYNGQLDNDEVYPNGGERPSLPASCVGYLDSIWGGDYLFFLGIPFHNLWCLVGTGILQQDNLTILRQFLILLSHFSFSFSACASATNDAPYTIDPYKLNRKPSTKIITCTHCGLGSLRELEVIQ